MTKLNNNKLKNGQCANGHDCITQGHENWNVVQDAIARSVAGGYRAKVARCDYENN